MKKEYIQPEMKICVLQYQDIVTNSLPMLGPSGKNNPLDLNWSNEEKV